jgi:hypothetical protein
VILYQIQEIFGVCGFGEQQERSCTRDWESELAKGLGNGTLNEKEKEG